MNNVESAIKKLINVMKQNIFLYIYLHHYLLLITLFPSKILWELKKDSVTLKCFFFKL